MLQVEADVRAAQAAVVGALRAADGARLRQRLAERGADHLFAAQLRPEGRPAQGPGGPAAEVGAEHVGIVVIERDARLVAAIEFETVRGMVPIQDRVQVHAAFRLRLDGGEGLEARLELVVEAGAVEGVGAVVLGAQAEVPADVRCAARVAPLQEGLRAPEIGVQLPRRIAAAAVRAAGGHRQLGAPGAVCQAGAQAAAQGAPGAALHMHLGAGVLLRARDDVDGADQRRSAVDASRRALQDLDPLDLRQVHGQVHHEVARLRVADVDAVEQHGDLVEGAAADADVGLDTHRTALAHVHPNCVFEQVVDGLGRRLADQQRVQHRDHPGGLMYGQRDTRPADRHFFEDVLGLGGDQRRQAQQTEYQPSHYFVASGRLTGFL